MRSAACGLALGVVLASAGCHDWEALSSGADADVAACGGRAEATCDASLAVCDGFDGGTLDDAWSRGGVGGDASVSAACAYRGGFALAAEVDAMVDGDARRADVFREVAAGAEALHLRFFVRVPERLPSNALKLGSLIQEAAFDGVVLRVDDGFVAINNVLVNEQTASTAAMPVDRWVCLELGVDVGTPGRVRVWMDDAADPVLDLEQDTAPAAPIDRVHVGLLGFDATVADDAFAVYVDEVALAEQRIGCAP